ncbi:MAG: hypothetical protein M1575_03395 [Patescibacteria group bacterium]|nr:hypothetical protein [Patescibacteria group bacterium]MCL5095744.1 hypothetical protein [Patescibacteria group bacterium]
MAKVERPIFDVRAEIVGIVDSLKRDPLSLPGRMFGLVQNRRSANNEKGNPHRAYWQTTYRWGQDRHGEPALVDSKGETGLAMIDSMKRYAAFVQNDKRDSGEIRSLKWRVALGQIKQFEGVQRAVFSLKNGESLIFFSPCGIDINDGAAVSKVTRTDNEFQFKSKLLPPTTENTARSLLGDFLTDESQLINLDKQRDLVLFMVVKGHVRNIDFQGNFLEERNKFHLQRLGETPTIQISLGACQSVSQERTCGSTCKSETQNNFSDRQIPIVPILPVVPLLLAVSLPSPSLPLIHGVTPLTTVLCNIVANDNDNPVSHVLSESASMFKILSLPNNVQINELFPKTGVLPAVEFIAPAERDMIKPYPNIQIFDRVREQVEVIIPQVAPYQPLAECSYVLIYESQSSRGQVVEQKNLMMERPVNFKEIPIFKPQIKVGQEDQIVCETARETITMPLVKISATADNQIGKILEVEAEIIDEDEMGKMLPVKPGLQFYDQPVLNEQTAVRPKIKTEDRSEEPDKPAVGKKVKVLAIKRLVVRPSLDLSSAKPDVVGVRSEIQKLIWVSQSTEVTFSDILELEFPKDQNQRLYSLLHFLRKLVKEKLGEDFLWQRRISLMNADGPADDLTETSGDLEDFQEIEYYFSLLQERGNYAQVFAFAN